MARGGAACGAGDREVLVGADDVEAVPRPLQKRRSLRAGSAHRRRGAVDSVRCRAGRGARAKA